MNATQKARSTTVVAVLRDGRLALGADGQVTLGETVMKQSADKVRRVGKGRALVGFAGGVADALTLLDASDYRGVVLLEPLRAGPASR